MVRCLVWLVLMGGFWQGCRVSARVLQSLRSSWPLCVLRVPTAAAAVGAVDMGFFPAVRAKDRRYVEENCALWTAAIKIQVCWVVHICFCYPS